MTAGQLPEGRYGPRGGGRPRRWVVPVGLLLAVLAGLVVATIGYRNLGSAPVQGETLGFTLLGGIPGTGPEIYGVEMRLNVIRDDPSRPAVCIVRARSLDGEETGRKEIYVPPSSGPIVLTTVVRTSRPPVTADVFGCSLAVPPYLVPTPATDP
ncbi:MAG: DUF4307 domain-containing protein [Pseudonocardiaceae bacterium]